MTRRGKITSCGKRRRLSTPRSSSYDLKQNSDGTTDTDYTVVRDGKTLKGGFTTLNIRLDRNRVLGE